MKKNSVLNTVGVLVLSVSLFSTLLLPAQTVFAQQATAQPSSANNDVSRSVGIDVTNVYQITEQGVEDGDLMSNLGEGIKRSIVEYDGKLFGIYEKNPLVVFKNVDGSGIPIARSGTVSVNVSDFGGAIKKGDFITSSRLPGKGQKANQSGYVIGSSLTDFDTSKATKANINGKQVNVGQITVALRIEYAEIDRARSANRLFDYIDAALFSSVKNPEQFVRLIRYSGSVMVILATAVLAYLVFARSISNGIQAIGRNPLAKKSIQTTIILNIIFSSIVIILGIIASFIILRA